MNRSKGCTTTPTASAKTPGAEMTIQDAFVKIAERIALAPWRRVAAEFLVSVVTDDRKWATFEKSFKRLADAAWCERRASLRYPKTRRGKMILVPPSVKAKASAKPLKSRRSGTRTRSSADARTIRSPRTKTPTKQGVVRPSAERRRSGRSLDVERENAIVRRIVAVAMRRVSDLLAEKLASTSTYEHRSQSMRDGAPRARARVFQNLVDSESLTRDLSDSGESSRDIESLTSFSNEKEVENANDELFPCLPHTRAERATRRLAGELVPEAVAIWNKLAACRGLRRVVKLTPERRKKLVRVLEELCECNIETWKEACRKVARSAFLCGRNERGWQATFDFMIRPTAFLRVLEGVYDTRKTFTHGHDGADLAAGALALLAQRASARVDGALVGGPAGVGTAIPS